MEHNTFSQELQRFQAANPGYDDNAIAAFRKSEFPALDNEVNSSAYTGPGHAYLDFTGGNLAPKSLVYANADLLCTEVLGNPHSRNPTSNMASVLLEQSRDSVLHYFNAQDNYCCVFTANASAAARIVGECFPFQPGGAFAYLEDDHNSIIGLRQYARTKGANLRCIDVQDDFLVDQARLANILDEEKGQHKLFAFPAQSNANGVKHDLAMIKMANDAGWNTLLDAAAFVPTNRLDLGSTADLNALPDFVCISFYKMFGFPTGIGCLLIKIRPLDSANSPFAKLWQNKPFFAGGTVDAVVCDSDDLMKDASGQCELSKEQMNYMLHMNYQCFEDGTVNYLHIPAVKQGLEFLAKRNGPAGDGIYRHVSMLMTWLVEELKNIHYPGTQQRVAMVCGEEHRQEWGSTILVKFCKPNGKGVWAGTLEDHLALYNADPTHHKLSVRIGTFCNPGFDRACSTHEKQYLTNRLQIKKLREFSYVQPEKTKLDRPIEIRDEDRNVKNQDGSYPGGLRVSFGMPSNFHDLYTFLHFVKWLIPALQKLPLD